MTTEARGAVELAFGNVTEALVALRRAAQVWQELGAPYEVARTRALLGLACREAGDDDAAAFELEAARTLFDELGAAPDLARLAALSPGAAAGNHGLTDRELEVLRQLSSGATNKAIAAELVLSVRTVDRHVSNIFAKLGVSSRSAATAYAHEHGIV
jgi:DNA-binding CsgD family transcriptional regulator